MIDKVIADTVANERAHGDSRRCRVDEYYFKGTLSVPAGDAEGVLIVEAMAQTAAMLVVHTLGARGRRASSCIS